MKIINVTCENQKNPIAIDTSLPVFCYKISGDQKNILQKSYRICISSDIEKLKKSIYDIWDSKDVQSDSFFINYKGLPLKSESEYFYKIFVKTNHGDIESDMNTFETSFLNRNEFTASWIENSSLENMMPPRTGRYVEGAPSPYFIKKFNINKKIKKAKVYISSLGMYKISLNGKSVTEDVLMPGWSEYNKILYYQTYDITKCLNNGENVIGVILGDGWYSGCVGLFGRGYYGSSRSLYCDISIIYEDGTKESVKTDNTWKTSSGPIIYSDIMLGEYYDATKEIKNWDTVSFDDSEWNFAENKSDIYHTNFKGDFKSQLSPPMRINEKIMPISVTKYKDGKLIVDFAQNMVGWVRIKLKSLIGKKIVFRFGEMLNKDGTLYTENLRSARSTDIYICKGGDFEMFEPSFTFHGFRYMEVDGLDYILAKEDIEGCVVYSSNKWIGSFECDNDMVNKLYKNILWGQKGNFLDVPTDCPQRDERLGWTGDTQVFVKSACCHSDSVNFYKKWMADVIFSQRLDGSYTDVVPYINIGGCTNTHTDNCDSGNPAWADAGIIVPYTVYLMFGDIGILKDSYASMQKFIEYYENTSVNYIRGAVGYGDWLSINDDTPRQVISTAFVAYSSKLMSKIASILYKKDDASYYEKLYQNVKNAFRLEFIDEKTGVILGDTQTAYVLALKMDLVDGALKNAVAKNLKRKITNNGGNLSTGFVGVSYLLPMLSEIGSNDFAYSILLQETFPSWGYTVKNGATTIWERWNSYTTEDGFGDVGMNSFNHYSLGAIAEWFYQYMAGLMPDIDNPGFKKFIIKPHLDPNGRIKYVKAEYDSINGFISNMWKTENSGLTMEFTVAPGTQATVYVPKIKDLLKKEDIKISDDENIRFLKEEECYFIYSCASGTYKISY